MNSEWINNLDRRAKTTQLRSKHWRRQVFTIRGEKTFLNMTLNAFTKENPHTFIKNVRTTKDIIKKVKTPVESEKLLINHVSNKSLVLGICKECLQLQNKQDWAFSMTNKLYTPSRSGWLQTLAFNIGLQLLADPEEGGSGNSVRNWVLAYKI